MAQTFQISNGDVVIGTFSGVPTMIGNAVGDTDAAQAKSKVVQDLKSALSTNNVPSGASANINNLVGNVPNVGTDTISILLKRQINQMFAAILNLQRQRVGIRPDSELLSSISMLQIFPQSDMVSFQFRLDVLTVAGAASILAGTITTSGA